MKKKKQVTRRQFFQSSSKQPYRRLIEIEKDIYLSRYYLPIIAKKKEDSDVDKSCDFVIFRANIKNNFLYTCMQNPRLRTVYRQRKWPLLAPVRKIMTLGRKKMWWGSKFRTTECRTTDISKFPNSEYQNNER